VIKVKADVKNSPMTRKIVLEVQGREGYSPLLLRVTMYKARPEMLEVERR
jgi:hypothetical protein